VIAEPPRDLIEQLRREVFVFDGGPTQRERFGAEVEFIPVDATTGRAAPIDGPVGATLPVLRGMSRRLAWREMSSAKAGVPEFRTPPGGRITYEPGGQIEYSAPPSDSLSALLRDLRGTAAAIAGGLASAGLDVVHAGVDPRTPLEDVPLRLSASRYRRMDAHFATIGPHGARMMRQTASIQVCLDLGPRPAERWRLLNALTPYLAATFANSPAYGGIDTGHASVRRFIWGALDPRRTGVVFDGADPVGAYARFALAAPAILLGGESPPFAPFGEALAAGSAGVDDWRAHLTTLFPEVRPRGYFEVRSIDALDPRWYAAPLVFLAGLVADPATAAAAAEIAGEPDGALLAPAGHCGLADPALGARSVELFDLALRGAESLGTDVLEAADLDRAREFADRFTRRGRAPAADVAVVAGA
jgi:glutamate--cysteine ligase